MSSFDLVLQSFNATKGYGDTESMWHLASLETERVSCVASGELVAI